jgi:hypothetical protein
MSAPLTLVLAVWLAASEAPIKLAAPGLSAVGLDAQRGDFYTDQVAQQLAFQGLEVVTRSEVATLIGLERQRQLLGCSEGAENCMAELAGALGAEAVLVGEVAKVGSTYRLSIRVMASGAPRKLASAAVSGTTEDALLEAFAQVAPSVAREVAVGLGRPVPTPSASSGVQRSGTKRFAWIPAVVGGVALGVGGVGYFQARGRYEALRAPEAPLQEPRPTQLLNEGKSWQTVGVTALGTAGAALITAGVLYLFGSDTQVQAGVSPQAGVAVGGSWE